MLELTISKQDQAFRTVFSIWQSSINWLSTPTKPERSWFHRNWLTIECRDWCDDNAVFPDFLLKYHTVIIGGVNHQSRESRVHCVTLLFPDERAAMLFKLRW